MGESTNPGEVIADSMRSVVHFVKRSSKLGRPPPGTAPGTLFADPDAPPPVLRVVAYSPTEVVEKDIDDLTDLPELLGKYPVTWLNVDGLGNLDTLMKLGDQFSLHRLSIEDVVNVPQRSKVEYFPTYLFIIARMMMFKEKLFTEQISIFLGREFVLTFQEHPGDVFDPVRERIRGGRGRLRKAGPGYLAYALLDAVIDNYFPVLENLGEQLDALEDEALNRPTPATVAALHAIKRDLLRMRRSIWPLRDTLHSLLREETAYIEAEDRPYLQDCYDHTVRVMDLVESYREILSGLMDVYMSSVGNRMNEIMKVLTLFASVFIPLGFVAGLYGMNFDGEISPWNMPELRWYLGYPFALALMATIAGTLLTFFWRKGWVGKRTVPRRKTTNTDEAK